MTLDETIMILGIIKTAYPAFYKDMSNKEANRTVDLWAMMFENDNAKVVTEAVKALMCTLKFPPTIADVKEKIALITRPKAMSELEAWNMVRKAISYYKAQENFNGLPPLLQKLVGSPNQLREWSQMDGEVVNSVIQSNFMRSFNAKQKAEEQDALLPESTKAMIEGLCEKMKLTDGCNERVRS